jgi:peptide deformylase
MKMIITDEKALSKPCMPCETLAEGLAVGTQLLGILSETKHGIGLAANQIGINQAVCVINVEKPIILINPKIVGRFGNDYFEESCLSFPNQLVKTKRWTNIIIESLNKISTNVFSYDKNPLECVCVQHEIDHLNGVTMFDREVKGAL